MGEVMLDDAMLEDPRIANAGPICFAVHVAALLYCSRNQTNTIPWARVNCLLDLSGVFVDWLNPVAVPGGERSKFVEPEDATDLTVVVVARHLCRIGLWEEVYEPDPREEGKTSTCGFVLLDAPGRQPSKPERPNNVVPFNS
jgi:hypothetical protein